MTEHTKRIGIFFNDPGFEDYPFTDAEYRKAYHQFAKTLTDRGAAVWIVRSQRTYTGGNTFSKGWRFDGTNFMPSEGPVEVEVIFNKGDLMADDDANLVNRQELEDFCTDKWKTYEALTSLFPRTLLANDDTKFHAALKEFSGMVTVKPVDGWRGMDVHIGDVATIAAKPVEFPCLVQEFINTAKGIPGLTDKLHDFRMISVNGKIIYSYIRTPPPDSFVSNYAQGGSWFIVPLDKIPDGAMKLFMEVEKAMRKFPMRIYSLDIGLHNGSEWKIFELNSKPALDPREVSDGASAFMDAVAELLMGA